MFRTTAISPEEFMYAAEYGDSETVRQYYSARSVKEVVKIANEDGYTAFLLAAYNGHSAIVEILRTADITNTTINGDTALILATFAGHTSIVNSLIKSHPRSIMQIINAANKLGDTALILAARHGHREIITMLIEAGADATVRNNEGMDAMSSAKDAFIREWIEDALSEREGVKCYRAVQ